MNRYILEEEQIGEGSFGNVYRATKKEDGIKGDVERKYYAVKKLKETFSSWDDVLNKREYHAIVAFMSTKKNIHTEKEEEEEEIRGGINHLVRVFEILREQDSCLYFVMEYMADGNLQDFISRKTESRNSTITTTTATTTPVNVPEKPIIEESEIRSILYQTFLGLRHVHNLGYVHRDIKPENIMLHGRTVKLGDFSLARSYHHNGNTNKQGVEATTTTTTTRQHETSTIMMTDYVGTRWYRAPEILTGHLSNTNNNHKSSIDPVDDQHDYYCCYTETVDTFAMGLVAAELYRCFPLFHGRNNTEQLKLIKDMLFVGRNDDEILFFEQKENDVIIDRLAHAIPTADCQVVSFIRDLLYFRPERRPSTRDILRHTYFNSFQKQQSQHAHKHHQHQHQYQHQQNEQLQQSSLGGVVNESVSVTNEEFAAKGRELVHILDTGPKQFHERNTTTSLSPLTPRGLFPTSMAGQIIGVNNEQSTMTRTVKAAKTITPATAGMTNSLKRKQRPKIRVSQIFNIE